MKNEPRRPSGHKATEARFGFSRIRMLVFGAVAVVSIAAVFGYAAHVSSRAKATAAAQPPISTAKLNELPDPAAATTTKDGSVLRRPYMLFRNTALGENYGRISAEFLGSQGGQRFVSPLQCDRVHFAVDHGICLEAKRGALTTYHAHIFDRSFQIKRSHPLAGPPSRARMSPDGRLAAVTVFVTGHSYASTGFTTRTTLIDAVTGELIVDDLEKFEVLRAGEVIKANDFNFWGVTFTPDGQRFYATLGTAGKTMLVEGELSARRIRVLRDDVECPSLSPDNTKIAFKRRQAIGNQGRIGWGVHVLELATGKETALLAEARNVDDQVEWLGNREVLYAMPDDVATSSAATHVWAIAIDGASAPRRLMPMAFSPAVVQ